MNYKKKSKSLAKQVWEMVRNDGTPDDMNFLRRIPPREYWGFGSNDLELILEKEVQLRLRLTNIAFILSLKLLYQQGYIIIRGSIWEVEWTDMLKWPQNPEYYHIDKNLTLPIRRFAKISSEFQNIRNIGVKS
jgi:hypothetical protein